MRYESLYNSHEQLARDIEDKMEETFNTSTVDPIKLVSSNSNNTNDLISLIKELSSANTKLKSDLMNCKEQLSDARDEITALMQKIDDNERKSEHKQVSLQDDLMKKSMSTNTIDFKKKPPISKRAASVKEKIPNKKEKTKTTLQPLPTVSSSMPTSTLVSCSPSSSAIVHHHYHYYVKNSKGERVRMTDEAESSNSSSNDFSSGDLVDCCDTSEKNDLYSSVVMDMGIQNNSRELVISPSASSVMTIKDGTFTNSDIVQSPYILLQQHVTQILERLRGSDILALNRRLKRAFDITELSSMSNSVIENILMDIEILASRFLWIKSPLTEQVHMDGFFPLLEVLKGMLKELGNLRTTMNELQVEYVKKVQESEARVEEEIIKKRLLKRQLKTQDPKPLAWITNMFYKTKSTDDGISTLTKTTTNSSTLIINPEEEDMIRKEGVHRVGTARSTSNTFDKRRQIIPHFPTQQPQMTASNSNGTSRSSHAIPIRNKRSLHRLHIDYEGIGPAAIRPIPSDPEWKAVNFSSSWLGGK
ncbi:hypothetical protein BDF21DRAFT_74811 [Thamnidium elegans]|nr:hypothetical protein BDF21DRAFT_74811 [Thamnidium elegans]